MKRISRLLLFVSFSLVVAEGLIGPIYAIFVKNIGGDVLAAGTSFGLFSIASGVFIFTFGRSRFFKERLRLMVFFGCFIAAIGITSYLFVSNPLELFITQIVIGIGVGILEPSWDGLFSANLSEDKATTFWATWAGGRDFLSGIAAIVGGVIVAAYSFEVLFIIMTIFSLASVFIAGGILLEKK